MPKRNGTIAVGTQDWALRKIAEGDIDGGMASGQTGTSIFDPVLCELAYRWFSPPDGRVLDPFAGGSVRGIVAGRLGRAYVGIDLSARQVAANRDQASICDGFTAPQWRVGDSLAELKDDGLGEFDFVFSCPPYFDLEIYSEDSQDLSTMTYDVFIVAYREIIRLAVSRLKPNRFACFVVGDVRDRKGNYRGFVRDTELAFEAAGAHLYNEAILVTAAGSLPLRAGRQFDVARKLGKTHQNVLVFLKGDAKMAVKAIGKVEFGEIGVEDSPPLV